VLHNCVIEHIFAEDVSYIEFFAHNFSSFLFIDNYSISKTKKGIHIYTHINMYNMNAFVLPYLISDNYLIVVCK